MHREAIFDYLIDVVFPWRRVEPHAMGPQQYQDAAESLASIPSIESPTVALFLLAEVKRVVDYKVASVRALEGKSVAQMGVSGTVLGLLAAFGTNLAVAWKALPLLLLLLSIFAYLQAIYARPGSLPSIGGYVTDLIANDEGNESRIAIQLATTWNEYGYEVERSNIKKAKFVKSGNLWLRLALLSLVIIEVVAIRS